MTDLRDGKPSYEELDAMYARAIGIAARLRADLDTIQAARLPVCAWRRLPMTKDVLQPECQGDNTDAAVFARGTEQWVCCPYCGGRLVRQ